LSVNSAKSATPTPRYTTSSSGPASPRVAFYSHFPTKEAVVAAIIAEADLRTHDVILGAVSSAATTLENLIVATLAVSDMTQRDSLARMADLLEQRFIQSSPPRQMSSVPHPGRLSKPRSRPLSPTAISSMTST